MSNNSQDEPDEYEIIFDGTNPDSAQKPTIEVSDGEPLNTPEFIDAEIDESEAFMKDHQSDAEDEDIEEGIFAPSRKEKTGSKKSAPLMWAVSLLAFVGVGAFVYVSNPDILSRVTSNIGKGDGITLPSDVAATDNLDTTSGSQILPTIAEHDASQDASSAIVTPTVTDAAPTESSEATIAPTTDLLSPDQTPVAPATASVEPAPSVAVDAPASTTQDVPPAVMTAAAEEPVIMPTTKVTEIVDAPASSEEVKPSETPSVDTAAATTATIENTSSSDVVIPTNDKETEADADTKDLANSKVTPAPTVTPEPEKAAPVAPQKVQPTLTNTKAAAAPVKEAAPVIVASKEEKKLLDDANLDQYFDSPSGKMLKDRPAPSMNPSKGGNESIIVVNKKAQKTKSSSSNSSPVASKVTIETTSLNTQMVSANRAMKLGRYDAAKEMYDELYKLNPRDAQILSGRAVLLQKMGFADQAIAAYEELLNLYPDNTDAIVNLSGLIRKQYPAVALNKLLDLHMKLPNNVDVTAQLGVAYADSGNYNDALRYLGDAAAMDPKNALHFYNMAVISEKAKKPEQAVSYYEKALEVDAIYGDGHKKISKETIYDRLAQLRGN